MINNFTKQLMSALLFSIVCLTASAQNDFAVPQCNADFTFEKNPTVNSSPYAYNFYDASTGDSLKYFWDFGDGTTSDVKNPMHAYKFLYKEGQSFIAAGNPTVCLTVYNGTCKSYVCKSVLADSSSIVIPACEAKIYATEVTYQNRMVYIPELKDYKLEAISYPDGAKWAWYYGDSLFSTQQSTFITLQLNWSDKYQQYGNEVCVKVTTVDGCETTACQFIPWYNAPEECYSYFTSARKDTVQNTNSALLQFYGDSKSKIVKWHWDFGDSTFSDEQNPVHEFKIPDIRCIKAPCLAGFQVCLTTTSESGCENTYCEFIYPSGYPQPNCEAKYSYSILESYPPVYLFKNESVIGDSATTFWDFGDGTFSYERNPSHVFSNKTNYIDMSARMMYQWAYNVCLTVSDGKGCSNTICQQIFAKPDTFNSFCKSHIKLSTTAVLGTSNCSGTASASLVDDYGNTVKAASYYWSTGSTSDNISNLCANTMYSVSISDANGCTVASSFAITDYSAQDPWSPPTYWGYEKYDSSYMFKSLINNPDYTSYWYFSDGSKEEGTVIYKNADGTDSRWVDLVVTDSAGNTIYTNRILLPGEATNVNSIQETNLKIYPVPAVDQIHIEIETALKSNMQLEVTDIMGKTLISKTLTEKLSTINVENLPKGLYICRVRSGNNVVQKAKFVK